MNSIYHDHDDGDGGSGRAEKGNGVGVEAAEIDIGGTDETSSSQTEGASSSSFYANNLDHQQPPQGQDPSSSPRDSVNNVSGGNGNEDDVPPVLEPEAQRGAGGGALVALANHEMYLADDANYTQEVEDGYFVENGVLYQREPQLSSSAPSAALYGARYAPSVPLQPQPKKAAPTTDSNICCGLCGVIVRYDQLVSEHLPTAHPEVLAEGMVDLEEIPYETWLNERGHGQPAANATGPSFHADLTAGGNNITFGAAGPSPKVGQSSSSSYDAFAAGPLPPVRPAVRSTRHLRRISQYRVNTAEMSIPELELSLQKKMVEKMGRKVPVTLMDKLHAKCGLCNTVISLNKKFEIVHLVRHFNAWHPVSHKCAGTWPDKEMPSDAAGKPLSAQDFAVIDSDIDACVDNLQCIWCGMFLSNKALGMHFHEVHPEEVEVPKCNLCMQELLINARLGERFGEDFGVTLPDEHTWRSIRFKRDFRTEGSLERAIANYMKRIAEGANPNLVDIEDMDPLGEDELQEQEQQDVLSCEPFVNSRMKCGRRAKQKRQFIMPVVRQAAPLNSRFVAAITHSHWKCKLCRVDIFAAVISAGVIKHYKKYHPAQLSEVQFELCKARMDKISDGNMIFVGEEEDLLQGTCMIECQICHMNFPMTPPFNICRAIRHIKIKHPEVMPEHKGGESTRDGFPTHPEEVEAQMAVVDEQLYGGMRAGVAGASGDFEDGVIYATELTDLTTMAMLRENYNVAFDRVFSVYGKEIEQQIYILTNENDELDAQTVEEIVKVRDPAQNPMVVMLNRMEHQQQPLALNLDGPIVAAAKFPFLNSSKRRRNDNM